MRDFATIMTFDQISDQIACSRILTRGTKPPTFLGDEIEYNGKVLTAKKFRQIVLTRIRMKMLDDLIKAQPS
jgi:hypothetical protein